MKVNMKYIQYRTTRARLLEVISSPASHAPRRTSEFLWEGRGAASAKFPRFACFPYLLWSYTIPYSTHSPLPYPYKPLTSFYPITSYHIASIHPSFLLPYNLLQPLPIPSIPQSPNFSLSSPFSANLLFAISSHSIKQSISFALSFQSADR
jgi:hypothetical protein